MNYKTIIGIICCAFVLLNTAILTSCTGYNGKPETDNNDSTEVQLPNSEKKVCGTDFKFTGNSDTLCLYHPHYSRIDLVCGTMPSVKDSDVIFCAEAAFTGQLLKEFKHSNIAGDHVSKGVRYDGYSCRRNSGAFVYYNDRYKFLYDNYADELDSAAINHGMGFGQEMMIHHSKRVPCLREDDNRNQFRALCESNGQLCIIDSKEVISFGNFIKALLDIGVSEAIYLDMGDGWNYSWWRDCKNQAHYIHNKKITYTTNWIVFYK